MATPDKLLSLKNQEKMKKIKSNSEDKGAKTVGGPELTWSTADYAKFSFDATAGVKPDTSIPVKIKGEKMHSIKEDEDKEDDDAITEEMYDEATEDDSDDSADEPKTEGKKAKPTEDDEDDEESDDDEDAEDVDEGKSKDDADDDDDATLDFGDDDADAESDDDEAEPEDEDEGLYLELDDLDLDDVKETDDEMIDLKGKDNDDVDEFMSAYEAKDDTDVEDEDESIMFEGDDEDEDDAEDEDESIMREEPEEEEESVVVREADAEEEDEAFMREAKKKDDEDEEDNAEEIKESKIRISFKVNEAATLFENNNVLSEDDKRQSRVLFESAVRVAAKTIGKQLHKEYQTRLNKLTAIHEKKMEKQVDRYLSYVVEQWAKENKVGLRNQLQNKLTENFLRGLKNLFVEHYIDIPDSKVNVVEALARNVKSLKKQLKESESRSVQLHTQMRSAVASERKALMKEHRTRLIAEEAAAVLPVDRGAFMKRAQTVAFNNTKSFKKDLVALREQYFGAATKVKGRSSSEPVAEPLFEEKKKTKSVTPVDAYAQALDKLTGSQS